MSEWAAVPGQPGWAGSGQMAVDSDARPWPHVECMGPSWRLDHICGQRKTQWRRD